MNTSTAVAGVLFIYLVMSLAFVANASELSSCAASEWISKSETTPYYSQLLLVEGENPLTYFTLGKSVGYIQSIAKKHEMDAGDLAKDILKVCKEKGTGAL